MQVKLDNCTRNRAGWMLSYYVRPFLVGQVTESSKRRKKYFYIYIFWPKLLLSEIEHHIWCTKGRIMCKCFGNISQFETRPLIGWNSGSTNQRSGFQFFCFQNTYAYKTLVHDPAPKYDWLNMESKVNPFTCNHIVHLNTQCVINWKK